MVLKNFIIWINNKNKRQMENVNETQEVKQIEPAEALAQLKKLFDYTNLSTLLL